MAMVLQLATFAHQYFYASGHEIPKDSNAIKFGIISTAMINAAAFIRPAQTHGGVIVEAIASRNLDQAKSEASKYKIPRAYGSYEELLAQSDIVAVYISLPNSLHAEWAKKALEAGKHVLLEKPFTSNAQEAELLVKVAKEKNLILLEAFHWSFHPASHVVHEYVASGKYGKVIRTEARMTTPRGTIPGSDIRWKYDLAGGSLMDMTYVISSTRYFLDATTPKRIVNAKARPYSKDSRVDEAMVSEMKFDSPYASGEEVTSIIYSDMNRENFAFVVPRSWELPSIKIECEQATIYYYNFMMPHLYHYIEITEKNGSTHTEKHYSKGPKWGHRSEPFWSTYRYQLEAFTDKIKGKEPVAWWTNESSIDQMKTIDSVYEASGLGKRRSQS